VTTGDAHRTGIVHRINSSHHHRHPRRCGSISCPNPVARKALHAR
jgi:hypothetical protein